ncbi:DNA (cytosine-5)-methyltransferase 3A-like [Prorops nasuta]|uniref:DNA (cytosine-5)-methyltransferase 3A-like n=1 Tax=Prorops nasuta TaxID=863751 RepID=UPI0034CEB96E
MVESSGKLWVFWLGESQISHLNEKTQIESFSTNLESRLAPQNTTFKKKHAINTVVQMIRKKLGCTILTKPYFSWLKKNLENIHDVDEINFCPYAPEVQRKLDKLKETNIKITEKYVNDVKRSPEEKVVKKLRKIVIEKDPTYLPLEEQQPGVITWAKIAGHNWWPAMIIDHRDGSMREPTFGCQWIIWYGDFKLSQVNHKAFLRFHKGMIKMKTYIQQTKQSLYLNGVLEAAKDYCSRLGINTESWKLPNAFKWLDNCKDQDIYPEPIVKNPKDNEEKYSMLVVQKINELKVNHVAHTERKENIKDSESLDSLKLGKIKLENICIMCLEFFDEEMDEHPFFKAFLCKQCSELYKPRVFVFGNDGKCFYCTLCSGHGTVVMCDKEDCPRVYCTACLKYLICPKFFGEILVKDPWECMLCKKDPRILVGGLMEPRVDWKERTIRMFRTNFPKNENMLKSFTRKNKKIRVLSLFDGLSTGLLVLLKLGISVDVYYASEIDPDALLVSESHFGTRVIQLGDVRDISENTLKKIAPIDLLIGGSPCNDLSLANPARLGLHDKNGTGILFFEYCRIKKLLKKLNRGNQFFWLFENVASMPSKYRLEINKYLGREPDLIDSADFSPQHRLRLYWHNLPIEPYSISLQSQQDVQDILTPNCNRYALVKKIRTVTTQKNSLKQGKLALKPIMMKDQTDTIWITELEEIFGFPRHYTDVKNMCATKRQHLIGRSWSVQTLMVVLSPLRSVFQTEERDDV